MDTATRHPVKALTLWQPWATLVAIGAKRIETRSWKTKYRGPLAIHAAASKKGLQACHTEPFRSTLQAYGYEPPAVLPRSGIIAICRLEHILPTEDARGMLDYRELAFGDYSNGRFAWLLRDVRRLAMGIPAKGRQGLWTWDYSQEGRAAQRMIESCATPS